MSMRPSVASRTTEADRKQFADDVEYYLSLTPRQLPSHYLYDELGSALFEAICRLPWYRITRAEQRLLLRHGREIFARVRPVSTLVELGPGSGEKLATLIDQAPDARAMTVHLVDVSASALNAARRMLELNPELEVVTHQATYEAGLAEASRSRRSAGRSLALFLGSNIGNFDPPGADAFLRNIRAALSADDSLLIGADLVKAECDLLLAYDDPLGVSAAFNRNLLVRVNRELGADFDIEQFSHRAVWRPSPSRIEMHLVSQGRQHVRVPAAHLDITFEADETIWTESSYKYRPAEVPEMLERAGFKFADQWVDEERGFALTLAEAA
jgi:L-histidine N-alpha-methyltransferase